MKKIARKDAMEYLFSAHKAPILKVSPGESFVVETEDAFSGCIQSFDDLIREASLPMMKTTPALSNPMGGPVYIEGAKKGDVLAVQIEKIEVDCVGRTTWTPGRGPLRQSKRWSILGEHFYHEIRHLPGPSGSTRDGTGVLNESVSWDLAPFIGTIGVAPEVEVATSALGQGPWGGNLDCRDIKEGTSVHLPVFHDGGLLFVGDVHASQGDTEFYGAADETKANVTLRCELIPNKIIPYVRLEKTDSIVSLFCFRPLEQAVEQAIVNLMVWMVEEFGLTPEEAYMHTTVNPDFRVNIYQMIRIDSIQYTVGAEIPKRYIKGR